MSDRAEATIVCDQELIEKPLTINLQNQPFETALQICARMVNASINRVGDAYVCGQTKDGDQVTKVIRMRGDPRNVNAALAAAGIKSQTTLRDDGTTLIVGTHEQLQKAEHVLAEIAATLPGQWHVQLFLVTMSNRDLMDLGLDIKPTASFSASMAAPPQNLTPGQIQVSAGLATVMRASRERSSVSVAGRTDFLLMDGGNGNFTRGAEILIPQRAVSGQGTITTTDFRSVQTGTSVDVSAREIAPHLVQLKTNVSLSELQEITSEGTPVTNRRTYQQTALAAHNSEVLLGSFDVTSQRKTNGHWLNWGTGNDTSYEILQVWGRVTYLGTPEPAVYGLPTCD